MYELVLRLKILRRKRFVVFWDFRETGQFPSQTTTFGTEERMHCIVHMQHYSGERLALLGPMSSGPIFCDLNGPSTALATVILHPRLACFSSHNGFFQDSCDFARTQKGQQWFITASLHFYRSNWLLLFFHSVFGTQLLILLHQYWAASFQFLLTFWYSAWYVNTSSTKSWAATEAAAACCHNPCSTYTLKEGYETLRLTPDL